MRNIIRDVLLMLLICFVIGMFCSGVYYWFSFFWGFYEK